MNLIDEKRARLREIIKIQKSLRIEKSALVDELDDLQAQAKSDYKKNRLKRCLTMKEEGGSFNDIGLEFGVARQRAKQIFDQAVYLKEIGKL